MAEIKITESPTVWLKWFYQGTGNGMDMNMLLSTLVSKGFRPAQNVEIMHFAMASIRFSRKSENDMIPRFKSQTQYKSSSENPTNLSNATIHWIDMCMNDGIDGQAVLQALKVNGISIAKDLLRSQRILRNECDEELERQPKSARDFFTCVKEGNLGDVELYLNALNSIEDISVGSRNESPQSALIIAATFGYVEMCRLLLNTNLFNVDLQDNAGLTALHGAAKGNKADVVTLLIRDYNANLYCKDNFGNIPLHYAARSGSVDVINILSTRAIVITNSVLSGTMKVTEDGRDFVSVERAESVFNKIINENTLNSAARHFRMKWCLEAAKRMYESEGVLFHEVKRSLGEPTEVITDFVLQHFYCGGYGFWSFEGGDKRWIETIATPLHLGDILCSIFRHSSLDITNKLGQTPLHLACIENVGDSHLDTITCLLHKNGCNVLIHDAWKRYPYDYLLMSKKGLNDPSGSIQSESYLFDLRTDILNQLWGQKVDEDNNKSLERCKLVLEKCCKEFETNILPYSRKAVEPVLSKFVQKLLNQEYSFVKRTLGGYDEYGTRDCCQNDKQRFYVCKDTLKKEHSAVIIQRRYRQRFFKPIPSEWYSNAFSFHKPLEFWIDEREKGGWNLLRERSIQQRDVVTQDGTLWEEYKDPISTEYFFFSSKTGNYQWCLQNEAKISTKHNLESTTRSIGTGDCLNVGDEVYYRFLPITTEVRCTITRRVALNYSKIDFFYDIVEIVEEALNKNVKPRFAKKCRRDLLRQIPRSYEDMKMEKMVNNWKEMLSQSREQDKRKLENIQRKKKHVQSNISNTRSEGNYNQTTFWNLALLHKVEERLLNIVPNSETESFKANAINIFLQNDKGVKDDDREKDAARNHANSMDKHINGKDAGHHIVDKIKDLEDYLVRVENKGQVSPRTKARRRVLRTLHCGIIRQQHKYFLCRWGCGLFVRVSSRQESLHETHHCSKRILKCVQGCNAKYSEEEWLKNIEVIDNYGDSKTKKNIQRIQWHQEYECPRRLVECGHKCGKFIAKENVFKHMSSDCIKRPGPVVYCRLGCGHSYSKGNGLNISEEEKEHLDACPNRLLTCSWTGCDDQIVAKDMFSHTKEHIRKRGVAVFNRPGCYIYQVPERCKELMIQLWGGGGGGSGNKDCAGHGGGGGFVEGILTVSPNEKLHLCVGEGGNGGSHRINQSVDDERNSLREAKGGEPGGGNGYASVPNGSGGGGGYSIVQREAKKSIKANFGQRLPTLVPIMVAGGGGGGGSRNGEPGGGEGNLMEMEFGEELTNGCKQTNIDFRNGKSGSHYSGGDGGESIGAGCCRFPSQDGTFWQGGNGSDNGGGGGGGLFGGGGGGTTPGKFAKCSWS